MLLALVLALSTSQVTGQCAAGRNCRAASYAATSIGQAYSMVTGATMSCGTSVLQCNAAGLAVFSSGYYQATNVRLGLFGAGSDLGNFGTAPPGIGSWQLAKGSVRTFQGTDRWIDVGSASHPVLDRKTYIIDPDRTAGAAPGWSFAPRAGGAPMTISYVGTPGGILGGETATDMRTTAVSGNQSSASSSSAIWLRLSDGFPRYAVRLGHDSGTSTSQRIWLGMSSVTPLPAGSSTPTAHAAVFRYDSTIGPNWFGCVGAGAALTCTDTTVAAVFSGSINTSLEIDCREGSAACTFWVNGLARIRVTTNLPTNLMGVTASIETLTAAQRAIYLGTQSIETR